MKFEEKFPSLKHIKFQPFEANTYGRRLIEQHCLEKQKVKEEIGELMERYHPRHFGEMDADDFRHLMKQLKKNLGLEDEE